MENVNILYGLGDPLVIDVPAGTSVAIALPVGASIKGYSVAAEGADMSFALGDEDVEADEEAHALRQGDSRDFLIRAGQSHLAACADDGSSACRLRVTPLIGAWFVEREAEQAGA